MTLPSSSVISTSTGILGWLRSIFEYGSVTGLGSGDPPLPPQVGDTWKSTVTTLVTMGIAGSVGVGAVNRRGKSPLS
jgi:hypothetical protein